MASDAKILAYIDAIEIWVLDSYCIGALISIPLLDRKLLAVRQYIRFTDIHKSVVWTSWAWNDVEIEAWYKSDAYKNASRLIDKINDKFQATNTGYKLRINKEVRTVEDQIGKWERSPQVLTLGQELKRKVSKELDGPGYSDTPGKAEAEKLRKYLAHVILAEKVILAAPGLSDHGHGNAYDFVVLETTGKEMAKASKAWISTWDGPHGWTAKLKAAIDSAGEGRFTGPLKSPYEPWHYEYG